MTRQRWIGGNVQHLDPAKNPQTREPVKSGGRSARPQKLSSVDCGRRSATRPQIKAPIAIPPKNARSVALVASPMLPKGVLPKGVLPKTVPPKIVPPESVLPKIKASRRIHTIWYITDAAPEAAAKPNRIL